MKSDPGTIASPWSMEGNTYFNMQQAVSEKESFVGKVEAISPFIFSTLAKYFSIYIKMRLCIPNEAHTLTILHLLDPSNLAPSGMQ